MEGLTKREEMTAQFATAIADCFKDEDDRELEVFPPIDLDGNDANDIILAMYDAVRLVFLKATPHNYRLTALCASCLHIFRHIAPKLLEIRQYSCVALVQSDEKSDSAICAQ